jgi:hypothetical protein
MTIKWIDPKDKLPPQGKKVLYCDHGDICVAQRYGHLWVPIPFVDSQFRFHKAPELWAEFNIPNGFSGKVHLQLGKRMLSIDEFEQEFPEEYKDLIDKKAKMWGAS